MTDSIAYWRERATIAEREMVLARKERREMFAALAPRCTLRYPTSKTCAGLPGMVVCRMGKCPLLKKGGGK